MIEINQNPINVRLDGKQTASIYVWLEDDAGNRINRNVVITVRGILKFSDYSDEEKESAFQAQSDSTQRTSLSSLINKNSVYPVLFTQRDIILYNGEGIITLLPRSEDLLDNFEAENQSETADSDITQIIIKTDVVRYPYSISVEITIDDDTIYGQTIDGYEYENPDFNGFVPEVLKQSANPLIQYYSDIDWIPVVDPKLDDNNSSKSDVLSVLSESEYILAFGASPMYDAIYNASVVVDDNDLYNTKKLIYLFSDDEGNTSVKTINDTIIAVNGVDGEKNIPIIISNFATAYPLVLSASKNITDDAILNKLAYWTGGQAITITSDNNKDELVSILYGEAVGALGYGTADFVVDLGQESDVSTITALFNLTDNSNSYWTVSFSTDGYTYVDVDEKYSPNTATSFSAVYARYIKFHIVLITGFITSSTTNPTNPSASSNGQWNVQVPRLTNIMVAYSAHEKKYLYLNLKTIDSSIQQISLSVNSNYFIDNSDEFSPNPINSGWFDFNNTGMILYQGWFVPSSYTLGILSEQVKVGVAKSKSHNWLDYYNDSQFLLDQRGKTVIPLRYNETSSDADILYKIDKYSYKLGYGKWDPTSRVIVYDQNGDIVSSSNYETFPRSGMIVFDQPIIQWQQYRVNIINQPTFRVGLEVTNKSIDYPLEISGIGWFYNTNQDLLPPVENKKPTISNITISPEIANIYTTISVSYNYNDENLDPEDTDNTEIKWYINGIRISYLDNKRSWNNIDNTSDPLWTNAFSFTPNDLTSGTTAIEEARDREESILKVNDTIYCIISATDGNLYSDPVQSDTVFVQEMIPTLQNIVVKAMSSNGSMSTRLQADRSAILTYNLISDSNTDKSEIIWYVNDEEFKRGTLGETASDATPADRIYPGDTNPDTGIVALLPDNSIYAKITPKTSTVIGDTSTSESIIVQNALPVVSNVLLSPSNPSASNDLTITYDFYDFDIDALKVPDQSNNTQISWYKKSSGSSGFTKQNLDNQTTISYENTSVGDEWKAVVTPNDTLENGTAITSNTVKIR